jgi:thiol:disulfide interchange protein
MRLAISTVAAALLMTAAVAAEEGKKPTRESIYDVKADARVQVEAAQGRAKADGKRVLLMFGGDWCGWCHKLHTLLYEDDAIARLRAYEYELVMIDTKAPNAEGYFKTASEGQTGVGYPFLAVLDADGKLLVGQQTDVLEEGDHHDPAKVKAFLEKWRVPPTDAETVVADALAQASSENKRVFLTFGAPWCGWCHRLEGYLAHPEVAKALADDFIVRKVDTTRMEHGADLLGRYRKGEGGGIPWYVVLDAEGKALATADADFGNIGYPFEPKEIDAFIKLFESQNVLEPAQLDVLRKNLESAAREIKAGRAKRQAG